MTEIVTSGSMRGGENGAMVQPIRARSWKQRILTRFDLPPPRREAQERRRARPRPTILSPRYGNCFDELRCFPGTSTPDGPAVGTLVLPQRLGEAVVNVDVMAPGELPLRAWLSS